MNDRLIILRRSFSIIHSCLPVVLVPYLLDLIYARMAHLGLGPVAVVLIIPLKVYTFSGLYGAFVEIASGEEIVLRWKNVKKNAAQFWKPFLALSALPFLVYAGLTLSGLNFFNIPIYVIYAHLNIVILFGMAHRIFQSKYLAKDYSEKPCHTVTSSIFIQLLGIYALSVIVFDLPYIYMPPGIDLTRFTLLIFYYFVLVTYLYIVLTFLDQHSEVEQRFRYSPEIYLINPAGGGIFYHFASIIAPQYPPFFVVIKALTPKNYKFREFNQIPWQERYFASGKLVAITCFTSNSPDCYRIAAEFRSRGSKVVLGGPHVSFLPEEALEYADCVVIGEAEGVWKDVIRDFEHGSLKKIYTGTSNQECYDLVHEELLHSPLEVIKDFLETSRGCKFRCHFCSVPGVSGGNLKTKPVSEIIDLIKRIKDKYKAIRFIDNNIYSDPAYTKELFHALQPLGVKWSTQCTLDIAKNNELLTLARESGCETLLIGFEVSEGSSQQQVGGKLGMARKYREYARKIKKKGIAIKAHFIFGFESDRWRTLWDIWKFCFAIQPDMTVLSILTPFPGTKIFHDMTGNEVMRNLNWKHYDCQAMVFEHNRMNSAFLAAVWPFIYIFFLLTTSRYGQYILFLIALAIYMTVMI